MADEGPVEEVTLLTRPEAADYLRVSLRHFDTVVRPDLTPVRIGARVVYDQRDIDAWVDLQKAGRSEGNAASGAGAYASRSEAGRKSAAPARQANRSPQKRPNASTPRLSVVKTSAVESDPAQLYYVDPQSKRLRRNG